MILNLPAVWEEIHVRSLGQEDPLEKGSPVFLPGESHGQRSLVGFSLWGRKELDTTEQLILSVPSVMSAHNESVQKPPVNITKPANEYIKKQKEQCRKISEEKMKENEGRLW